MLSVSSRPGQFMMAAHRWLLFVISLPVAAAMSAHVEEGPEDSRPGLAPPQPVAPPANVRSHQMGAKAGGLAKPSN